VIEGGYSETIWKECSNCNYWTKKQKELNYCSKCKNSGGSSVKGSYIPKSNKKYSFKDYKGGWNGNNISGFSALPSGARSYTGNFYGIEDNIWSIVLTGVGGEAFFWSSTNIDSKYSNARGLHGSQELFYDYDRELNYGFSIRCTKNSEKNVNLNTTNPFGEGHVGSSGPFDGIGVKFDTIRDGTYRIRINDPVLPKFNNDVDVKFQSVTDKNTPRSKSGYELKLLGTELYGKGKRRTKNAQKIAKQRGAVSAFVITFVKPSKDASVNDNFILDDIKTICSMGGTVGSGDKAKYNDGKHTFIIIPVKSTNRKKVSHVWIYDTSVYQNAIEEIQNKLKSNTPITPVSISEFTTIKLDLIPIISKTSFENWIITFKDVASRTNTSIASLSFPDLRIKR
jgi:hypothetical protein